MILEDILDYLKIQDYGEMPELDWKGLCQKMEEKQPDDTVKNLIAQYQAKGEFLPVNFDSAKALIYFRKDGESGVRELDEEELVSCETLEEITWNLKAVICATKDFRQNDNAYTADQIALALKDILTLTNPRDLLTSTDLVYLTSRITGYETEVQKIADEEQITFDYNHTFISLKMTIVIQAKQGCINFCE